MKSLFTFFLAIQLHSSYAQISDFKHIDFTKADNIVKLNAGKSLENLPLLAHHLTSKLSTDVEKFRAIFTWVSYNISGDPYQHKKVSKKQKEFKNDSLGYIEWNNKYKKVAFKKLLKHKKTMCTGYAYLIKELCFIANIECKIIDGYGRSFETNVEALESLNHSWNAVKLNNKWYLCDATWSSGYMINGTIFVKDYNDGYFLTDPLLFAKNHFPLKRHWSLNDSLINSRFIPEPIVYGETFKEKVIPISPVNLNTTITKNTEVSFSFKSLKTISLEDVALVKIYGPKEKSCQIYELNKESDVISFKHLFKNKGTYDVHLKIKTDIVATYTIKVTKN